MSKLIDTPKCLLVEVPEGAERFVVTKRRPRLFMKINGKHRYAQLPPGSYGQPILASEMTLEKWSEIIPDYSSPKSPDYMLRFNLQPSNTVVIPKTI